VSLIRVREKMSLCGFSRAPPILIPGQRQGSRNLMIGCSRWRCKHRSRRKEKVERGEMKEKGERRNRLNGEVSERRGE